MSDQDKPAVKTIKIFNLTDVPTPTLEQHHSVGITFAAGRALVGPGESTETAADEMTIAHLAHYVTIGAASVDVLPPSYVVAKEKTVAAQKKKPATPPPPLTPPAPEPEPVEAPPMGTKKRDR